MSSYRRSLFAILLFLGALALTGLFGYDYWQAGHAVRRAVGAKVDASRVALARAIVAGDWLKVAEFGRSFEAPGFLSLGIEQEGRILFSAPSEDSIAKCKPTFIKTIELYGVETGRVVACTSSWKTAAEVLQDPSFLMLALLLGLFTTCAAILPLLQYRNSLKYLMGVLMQKTAESGNDAIQSDPRADPISRQLIELVNQFSARQKDMQRELDLLEQDKRLTQLAKQIAHDIRSPLSALNMVAKSMQIKSDPNTQLIEKVVERINGIASQLLNPERARPPSEQCYLPTVLSELLQEKKFEYQNLPQLIFSLNLATGSSNAWLSAPALELKQILSNLLNNAAEACTPAGRIDVSLLATERSCTVLIQDTGAGIPAEVLATIGKRGVSFGKQLGNGLGVYAAKQWLIHFGGELVIQSAPHMGTCVRIDLPLNGVGVPATMLKAPIEILFRVNLNKSVFKLTKSILLNNSAEASEPSKPIKIQTLIQGTV